MPSFRKTATFFCLTIVWALTPSAAYAQGAPPALQFGDVRVAGTLRTRTEVWNWFGDSPAGEYTYPGSFLRIGLSQSKKTFEWRAELEVPFILGLPSDAVVPGAQGALGLGGNYYAANDNQTDVASVFIKQAAVRFKQLAGVRGQSLNVGRFEFIDGTERTPADATLVAVKRDRIAHRLIGNFGFTHVGRSVDGAQYGLDRGEWNVTIVAFRPTRGVFDVDGWENLHVNVIYGAVTKQAGSVARAAEWRAFGIGYVDTRHDVLKVDNRPTASRRADNSNIAIATIGGHYVQDTKTSIGTIDLLLWGVAQTGSWGTLSHRAGAAAAEAGWQPDVALKPWFRGGWNYGSGDGDADDSTHGTFFQLLPTPRVYARLPFFNMMNTSDAFVEIVARPSKAVTLRGDMHALRLANAADLWYQGGGAYQPSTFGYAGRPSNGRTGLAMLGDISGDLTLSSRVTLSAYYGHATGQPVTEAIYGAGAAHLAYLEVLLRF